MPGGWGLRPRWNRAGTEFRLSWLAQSLGWCRNHRCGLIGFVDFTAAAAKQGDEHPGAALSDRASKYLTAGILDRRSASASERWFVGELFHYESPFVVEYQWLTMQAANICAARLSGDGSSEIPSTLNSFGGWVSMVYLENHQNLRCAAIRRWFVGDLCHFEASLVVD